MGQVVENWLGPRGEQKFHPPVETEVFGGVIGIERHCFTKANPPKRHFANAAVQKRFGYGIGPVDREIVVEVFCASIVGMT